MALNSLSRSGSFGSLVRWRPSTDWFSRLIEIGQRPCGRPGPPEDRGRSWRSVSATIDVADLGRRCLIDDNYAVDRRRARRPDCGGSHMSHPPSALASYQASGTAPGGARTRCGTRRVTAKAFSETHQLAERFAGDGFHAVIRLMRYVRVGPVSSHQHCQATLSDPTGPIARCGTPRGAPRRCVPR